MSVSLTARSMLFLALLPGLGHAQDLDDLMNGLFHQQPDYIGHDSVEREDIPRDSVHERKYLVVDFRYTQPQETDTLQASVHRICMALLRNQPLIRDLSDRGYDMVSVAFDRHSQYDCL